jgi:hypothetical protein
MSRTFRPPSPPGRPTTSYRRSGPHDIGAHRVEPSGSLLADDGIAARIGLRVEDSTDANGLIVMAGPVAHLGRTPLTPGRLAEPFGAHSDEIRRELGFEAGSSG